MNKINKGIGLGLLALLSFASCSDWSDHYEDIANSGGSASMWNTLQEKPELSDFCEVLQATKYFRQHKVTAVSYADMLQQGNAFTVMAPVNGSFDKEAYLRQLSTPQGDSVVEKTFVLNHLSRNLVSVTGQNQEFLLANGKKMNIGMGKIEDVTVKDPNNRTHNGVLHIVETALPYKYNIFETLCDFPQFGTLGTQMKRFSWDEFDQGSSLQDGTIDGVPVYVDSVVIERNKLFEEIGLLNAEDSTYLMVVPSNNGWNKAMDTAKKYFVYDATETKGDSLQLYWSLRGLLDDAIYSTSVQKSPKDSLVSWKHYDAYRPYDGHVYRKPFEAGGIMGNPTNILKCSNGTIYETAEWPFTPYQTFFKVLRTEGESRSEVSKYSLCTFETHWQTADTISNDGYMGIIPEKTTSNWEVTYKVKNSLSGKYDICVVVLPLNVEDPKIDPTKQKPCRFNAFVTYNDLDGSSKEIQCAVDGTTTKEFTSDPFKTDTIVIAKGLELPACNYVGPYSASNEKVTVRIKCNIPSTQNLKYSRKMLLDCIVFRPTKEE